MEPAIQCVNIHKTFRLRTFKETLLLRPPRHQTALDNVSLTIEQGQVFGLLGSNGAGKTTLVKIIAGLISLDQGQLKVFGQAITDNHHESILANVGLVTNNERTFYWRMSGRENLDFFGTLCDLPPSIRKLTIQQLLQQMELEEIADRPFMTYSMGQKQRFSIARSLLNNPRILLFDEATSNLDPISTRKLLKFVNETLIAERKHTVLWCTHNLAEAQRICHNIAILHNGKVISQGTMETLQSKFSEVSRYLITVSNWKPTISSRLSITPETIETTTKQTHRLCFVCQQQQVPTILRELLDNQVNPHQCVPLKPQLEEVFEKEIQRELEPPQASNSIQPTI